ncbi:MAG TPA: helix-turn-helix transcriptional regulator [Candidatus Polarisedimenticolaceae bacterium]|nr:helix-turn-helix transcriptional regulator [Candidatus Polarisedimenticolaceae bacterium]
MSSFGEELKRERELRQISLREVSEATKINLRYLEALEQNDFRHLPGGVFNKGFVRAYAEYIGVDPEAMVNAYLLEERAQEEGDEGKRVPVPRHTAPVVVVADPLPAGKKARLVVLVALVLTVALVAGGLLWYWLARRGHEGPVSSMRAAASSRTRG